MQAGSELRPQFSGSVPEVYDKYLVPLIFEPYAIDLAERAAALPITNILELAAGTGVLTRRLAMALPGSVFIIATDLSQPMLDQAASVGTRRPVEWRQADALALPFDKASFDAVVCQFGVMFFPDKARAFAEIRRVLRRGGVLLFNTWDRIEDNEFAQAVNDALVEVFPANPPRFLARLPHGYHDIETLRRDLSAGGFSAVPEILTLPARSRAASAHVPAVAYCQGTPLRGEIEARDPAKLLTATAAAEAALEQRFGTAAVDGRIQAHVVSVEC
ncbi:MAG TPA: class I SAM-dependent methyltransferase [Steroidobacteraceae bacterium]|jgi:ubiquinone/menaquinone biosynthesis C-methylase UbiE|nr:class I SAM-dependent methyltransferase [Steroidobacteraceae bacterium]